MPEGVEICITADYLNYELKNMLITEFSIVSGRYTHESIKGLKFFEPPYKIDIINSKGKLLWFELSDPKNASRKMYILNTLGLTGGWSLSELSGETTRIKISCVKNGIVKTSYYSDQRNFGTFEITDDVHVFNKRINAIAMDLLKSDYDYKVIKTSIDHIISSRNNKGNMPIVVLLMEQKRGIGSGLGNYLTSEILYHAKISPKREIKNLTDDDIKILTDSIKYIIKLAYVNNQVGYMTRFANFSKTHKRLLKDKILPNYHPKVKLGRDKFDFKVYRRKVDPFGNKVIADKIIKGRSTYWVPAIQN